MLLDIGSVFAGIGLAVVGFVIVIVVCVVILRLLAAILPSYEDRGGRVAGEAAGDPEAVAADVDTVSAGDAGTASADAPSLDEPGESEAAP